MLNNAQLHRRIRWLRTLKSTLASLTCLAILASLLIGLDCLFTWTLHLSRHHEGLALLITGALTVSSLSAWILLDAQCAAWWNQTEEGRALAALSPTQQYFHEIHASEPTGFCWPVGLQD
jgi:hypothetical protein